MPTDTRLDGVAITPTFEEFPKVARLSRDMVITEKIDGTNAQILVGEDGSVRAGSRSRWIVPEADNFGFARWVQEHADELRTMGPGRHFGEWWGNGIQRGYGLPNGDKRFSLFNVGRWGDDRDHDKFPSDRPACCHVVPVLVPRATFDTGRVDEVLIGLARGGSVAAPGFMKPEGVVVWHAAGSCLFKKTLDKNDGHKGTR